MTQEQGVSFERPRRDLAVQPVGLLAAPLEEAAVQQDIRPAHVHPME